MNKDKKCIIKMISVIILVLAFFIISLFSYLDFIFHYNKEKNTEKSNTKKSNIDKQIYVKHGTLWYMVEAENMLWENDCITLRNITVYEFDKKGKIIIKVMQGDYGVFLLNKDRTIKKMDIWGNVKIRCNRKE